ncbi:MAG: hypothetical protein SFV15_06590 [Polyangiaceae bacterium]|nr:hypothetical protein [Polyangiaceae bacterium]
MHKLQLTLAALLFCVFAAGTASAGSCEQEVVAECVANSCPTFCRTLAEGHVEACKVGCTAQDRCKLALFGGQDRPAQVELDAQKREQLMSCLAENRKQPVVPKELGKPIRTEADYVAPSEAKTKAVKRSSLKNTKASKAAWKARKARSFAERKVGSKRKDPLTYVPPAGPVKSPPRPPLPRSAPPGPMPPKPMPPKPMPPKPRPQPAPPAQSPSGQQAPSPAPASP